MLLADHLGVIMCKVKKNQKNQHIQYNNIIAVRLYSVCIVLQDPAKVIVSMMFMWCSLLYCVTGLSQSENIHDVHFIVLCYRTEPKWEYP